MNIYTKNLNRIAFMMTLACTGKCKHCSEGNTIFPAGNVLAYLKEYFNTDNMILNPYIEDFRDIHSICIGPEGNVLRGNIYQKDILEILSDYVLVDH